ncbi:hypothetical protein FHR71_002568 [Methylobacterium sp. RAS18]|nr:hypothetical protein [Methylobacterium sp. RAS18]
MRIALTLAAGALLGSLGLGVVSASAAPPCRPPA